MACAPSEYSDQPGHPPSLFRVFAVRMMKAWILSYLLSTQRIPWSDWVDAQADLGLRWAHRRICWFCHEATQTLTENSRECHTCRRQPPTPEEEKMSRLMRLWHSIFKQACAAIHCGYTSGFLSDPSSTATLYLCVRKAKAFAVRLCDKYHNIMNWLKWTKSNVCKINKQMHEKHAQTVQWLACILIFGYNCWKKDGLVVYSLMKA